MDRGLAHVTSRPIPTSEAEATAASAEARHGDETRVLDQLQLEVVTLIDPNAAGSAASGRYAEDP